MKKAYFWALFVLLIGEVFWYLFVNVYFVGYLALHIYRFFPLIAAFVASLLAPTRKVLIGLSVAALHTVISTGFSLFYEYYGITIDRIGLEGVLILSIATFLYDLAYCTVGTICGVFVSRKRVKHNRTEFLP